jgi:hypothetical protein
MRVKLKDSTARQYAMLRQRLRQRREEREIATAKQKRKSKRKPRPFLYRERTKPAKPSRRTMREQWVAADQTFCWLLGHKDRRASRRLTMYLLTMLPPKPTRDDDGELVT